MKFPGNVDKQSFLNPDLPLDTRTKISFLFGLKRMLVGWGISKTSIQFNDETFELSIGGPPALKVNTDNSEFQIEWLSKEWEEWKEFTEDPDYKALVKVAEDRMEGSKTLSCCVFVGNLEGWENRL